jgi:DNA-directed RNA polymerase specialized sigma24 family protein/CheY-like chemotaxis protein
MVSSHQITEQLPYLRRYARALTGSQSSGDALVAATLQAILADRKALESKLPIRLGLYKLFHALWANTQVLDHPSEDSGFAATAVARLRVLTPPHRQSLLLTTVEGFSADEASEILGVSHDEIATLVKAARAEIEQQSKSRILIIEDEMLIAVDLSDIVRSMGHAVVAIVDTADKAIDAANLYRPDLILADIQLADGSSGIDAVEHILKAFQVPVMFITAFPDRLLTGNRPEPTFLITKPYVEKNVLAAVSQVLFFQPAQA